LAIYPKLNECIGLKSSVEKGWKIAFEKPASVTNPFVSVSALAMTQPWSRLDSFERFGFSSGSAR
jgi:hypothetical protein